MLRRIEARVRPGLADVLGRRLAERIGFTLGLPLRDARIVKVFTLAGLEEKHCRLLLERAVLHDPVLQEASLLPYRLGADWVAEVAYRPGVTDNEGRTAQETVSLVFPELSGQIRAYTSSQYHFYGELSPEQAGSIVTGALANGLIERFELKSGTDWEAEPGFAPRAALVLGEASDEVETLPLSGLTDEGLENLSRERTWAMSLQELRAIRDYYARPEVRRERAGAGLPPEPLDAEMEVLAQTWSEHCKHKIFSSSIDYVDTETGRSKRIDGLYKTCIQDTTRRLRAEKGEKDFCRSVFKDNAGVVQYAQGYHLCIKVETHNSPSALDPYGGALTGIVGVNRDPMGTGLGATLLCNTDVFCFASPFYRGELPPRLLHPRRVMEGVRKGVEDGGNKSGVPTVNGSVIFDERFLGKPLVFCGTVGLLPESVRGRQGFAKKASAGDVIVMAGGRIGKDGIHGATFSSEELHEGSPATAVQIGDPITQRKLYDFILAARDRGLYSAITDNGAGGLSSSVGEMALDSGGCRLDLRLAPLKYDGLRPWEILLSEAQERMTLAVPRDNLEAFLSLARVMEVEATALGEFTDDGFFHALYGRKTVARLSMDFMHNGTPRMRLEARWTRPSWDSRERADLPEKEQGAFLKRMLGSLNICSREYIIRQYDHEVRGGSVVKPLVGARRDGPADAAVLRPLLDRPEGLVLSHGICPKFSDYDTYWMTANAVDEAVRNAVAVGADPGRMAGVDNFCWCDPVQSEKTPDGRYKLAQLVRANEALADFCLAYGVPCISGKDSMKNDYSGGGVKISIPPTVLFSLLGFMDDASRAVTPDFKRAGDVIHILGTTGRELAGSEIMRELGKKGGLLPRVEAAPALLRYRTLHQAIGLGLVNACHDLSDGGLAVALAEMALGGRLGASVDVSLAPVLGELTLTELLYSESSGRLLLTTPAEKSEDFRALFQGQPCAVLGSVREKAELVLLQEGRVFARESVEELAAAFKGTFRAISL
ncbi:MAG: phosphoribosylformylglycinamidine synthase [Deltaproteobacteria bacterium]|jgi:phosphoribosylformylglycinamidine synthase|nr:phosphoribosylformylglycinamidine synthase [Deltaproteobacteria bacterium]